MRVERRPFLQRKYASFSWKQQLQTITLSTLIVQNSFLATHSMSASALMRSARAATLTQAECRSTDPCKHAAYRCVNYKMQTKEGNIVLSHTMARALCCTPPNIKSWPGGVTISSALGRDKHVRYVEQSLNDENSTALRSTVVLPTDASRDCVSQTRNCGFKTNSIDVLQYSNEKKPQL